MTRWQLRQAVHCIHAGGVIAYPTEAVYGLGCDPLNHNAVAKILKLKQRDINKGLILIAATQQQLELYIETPSPEIQAKLDASWPGPVTWLLPARPQVPRWITGAHDTIAVRVTAHPIARALCQALGHPLISTSANISRCPAAQSSVMVRKHFHSQLDYLVTGAVGGLRQPTQIRHAVTDEVLR